MGKVRSIAAVILLGAIAMQPLSSDAAEAEPDMFEDANLSLAIRAQDRYLSVLWHADRDGNVERLGFLNWSGENISLGDWIKLETSFGRWDLVPSFSFSSELIEVSLFESGAEKLNFDPGLPWALSEDLTSKTTTRVLGFGKRLYSRLVPDNTEAVLTNIVTRNARLLMDSDLLKPAQMILGDVAEGAAGAIDSALGFALAATMLGLYYPMFLFIITSLHTPFSLFEEVMLTIFGFLAISGPTLLGLSVKDLDIHHEDELGVDNLRISFSELSVAHLFTLSDFGLNISGGNFELDRRFNASLFGESTSLDIELDTIFDIPKTLFEIRAGEKPLISWGVLTLMVDLRTLPDFIERREGKTTLQIGTTLLDESADLELTRDLFP